MAATADDLYVPKLDGLPPSKIHKQLGLFARDCPKDIVNRVLQTQQPNIHPQDYGELLFHVRLGERTLAALQSPWRSTRSRAVKALAHQWNKSSRAVEDIGGVIQLADVLNSIPFDDAKSLACLLSQHHGEADPRTEALDGLVALIAPSLFPSKSATPHPASRLASAIVPRLLPALSFSTASQIIDVYGAIPSSSLRTLTKWRPEVIVHFLSATRDRDATAKITLTDEVLCYIFAFRKPPRMPTPATQVQEGSGGHWGTNAFLSLLEKADNGSVQFVPTPSLVCSAAVIALRASRGADQQHRILIPVCKALQKAHNDDLASTGLTTLQRIILAVALLWKKADPATGNEYEDYIKHLGKISILPNQAPDSSALHFILNPLPARRRLLVLNFLYGEALETSHTFRCPPQLLSMLPAADGIKLLANIRCNFPEKPFSTETWPDTTSPVANQYTVLSRTSFESSQSRAVIYEAALRHSWDKDNRTAREALLDVMAYWKESAHREPDADKRATAARLVIRIADLSGDSKLVLEAYRWVLERFEKDRNVQESLSNSNDLACLAGYKWDLVQSAQDGDEVLLILLDNLRRSQEEPEANQRNRYRSLGHLIFNTLDARVRLLDRHSVPDGDAYAILAPLGNVLLEHHKLRRTNQTTYGLLPYWPHLYDSPWVNSLSLSKRTAAPVIRMLDGIGKTTEEGYERVRTTVPVDGETPEINVHTKRWPWFVGVEPAGDFDLPWDQAPFLCNYLEKILFQPLSEATEAVPKQHLPLLDAEREQWARALDMYLKIAKDRQERERRILAVRSHYLQVPFPHADGEKEIIMDLSSLVLLSHQARETILRSEPLVDLLISSFFPADIVSNEYRIGEGLPPALDDWPRRNDEDCCLRIRIGEFEPPTLLKWALTLVMRAIPASRVLQRRMAIVGGVMFSYTIPQEQYHPPTSADVTLGSQVNACAITFPAPVLKWLYEGKLFQGWGGISAGSLSIQYLLRGSDNLSEEELKSIVARIESLKVPESNEQHRERVIRLLATKVFPRTAYPDLLEEQVFLSLKDKTKSTAHRQWFSRVLLRFCPPTKSVRLLDRLFDIVTNGLAHNIEETQDDVLEELGNQDGLERPKTNASVKITTVKHLVVMLASSPSGLSIAAVCARLTTLFEATSHPSVQSALLQTFIDLLIRDGPLVSAPDMDMIFGQLERIALRACGLDGKSFLAEEDWSQERLPVIDPGSTAANGVLGILRTQVPASFAKRYINIVESMYAMQTKNSKRWMVEYMQRNTASETELKAMEDYPFGPILNLRYHLGVFVRRWRREISQDSILFKLIYDLPTAFLRANSVRPFLERLRTTPMQLVDEQMAQDFKSLVGIWDQRDEHIAIIVHGLSLLGNQEDSDALKNIFSTLLLPANQSVVPGSLSNPGLATPNDLVLALIDHLKPQKIKTPIEKEAWLKHIRPLVAWLRDKVKEDQSKGIPGTRFNVGAAYARVLVKLEVLLLPYPILGQSPSNPHMAFAESLTEIGLNIIHQPLSLLNLPYLLETLNQSDSITQGFYASGPYRTSGALTQAQAPIQGYLDDTDAEPLVRALLTVLSKTKRSEDRFLTMLLIKTVANWWGSKETIWKRLCEIVDPLAEDEDGAVRVLSIPMTVAPLPVLGE